MSKTINDLRNEIHEATESLVNEAERLAAENVKLKQSHTTALAALREAGATAKE